MPEQLVGQSSGELPGMPGSWALDDGAARFMPRHPFLPGTIYALVWREWIWTIEYEAPPGATSVVGIFPSAAELPLNNLKLYIQFSGPMSEGWAQRAVTVRQSGAVLQHVLLDQTPELWDPGRRRLTLLFEPGRVKRGLAPNLEYGNPIQEGRAITLNVDDSFRDANGRALRAGAERTYRVGPAVRRRVDPAEWRWRMPPADSRSPLTLDFDRPLDRALLEHSLRVTGPSGPLLGQAAIGTAERSWTFIPESPWEHGEHFLDVNPLLEDLAGNSLLRVFDRDLDLPEDDPRLFTECRLALGAAD